MARKVKSKEGNKVEGRKKVGVRSEEAVSDVRWRGVRFACQELVEFWQWNAIFKAAEGLVNWSHSCLSSKINLCSHGQEWDETEQRHLPTLPAPYCASTYETKRFPLQTSMKAVNKQPNWEAIYMCTENFQILAWSQLPRLRKGRSELRPHLHLRVSLNAPKSALFSFSSLFLIPQFAISTMGVFLPFPSFPSSRGLQCSRSRIRRAGAGSIRYLWIPASTQMIRIMPPHSCFPKVAVDGVHTWYGMINVDAELKWGRGGEEEKRRRRGGVMQVWEIGLWASVI